MIFSETDTNIYFAIEILNDDFESEITEAIGNYYESLFHNINLCQS